MKESMHSEKSRLHSSSDKLVDYMGLKGMEGKSEKDK